MLSKKKKNISIPMVDEVVESIQELLKGNSYELFDRLSSDSSYLSPCQSVFENVDYSVQIRFNVCKIILILIKKFASTSWPVSLFADLESWILSLIDKKNLPGTNLNDLSTNVILAKELGQAYGCLIYSYRREDKEEFLKFIPRILDHSKSSKSGLISSLNLMIGICFYFHDLKEDRYIDTGEMVTFITDCLSQIDPDSELKSDQLIIQFSLELMNSILLIYHYKGTTDKGIDEIAQFVTNCYQEEIKNVFIGSSLFMENYLAQYFLKFDDINIRNVILEIFFKIASFNVGDFKDYPIIENFYDHIFTYLMSFINIILEVTTFTPEIWQYINLISMISYKIQRNLNIGIIQKMKCYPDFVSLYYDFIMKIIFSFDNEEINTNCLNAFFEDSKIFSNFLIFWTQSFEFFINLPFEMKKLFFDSTTNILKKGIDFLFFALHEDHETTFITLHEDNSIYRFSFLSTLLQLSGLNIKFFGGYFNEMLDKYCGTYLNDRGTIENELDLSLALCICSQFMVKYSSVKTNTINYDYLNFIESDSEIPQTSEKLDFFEIGKPIISQILNLIFETNNEESIQQYIEFHQKSSEPTFLENSVLNFIYNFKYMIFYHDSDEIKAKMRKAGKTKDEIVSMLFLRIANDIKFYSVAKFEFIVDIVFRIIDTLTNYYEITSKNIFISSPEYFEQLLKVGDLITKEKSRKRYNENLFKIALFQKEEYTNQIIESYANQLEEFSNSFDECLKSEEETQKFKNLLIDYSVLFNYNYMRIFDSIFPKYFKFFEDFSVQIFAGEEIAPSALSFWNSITNATGTHKIEFHKYSPNGVLLFRTSVKALGAFYNNFNQYANDENIGNYLKCLDRALIVYKNVLTAKYFSFKVFEIYQDNTLFEFINLVSKSVMKFDLKNLFSYKKIGETLTDIAEVILNTHTNVAFSLENEILVFLFHILENSIFAPNYSKSLNNSFQTLKKFIDFCGNRRTEEKITELLMLLNDTFKRFFLEIWQLIFNRYIHIEKCIDIIFSFLSFYQCFPVGPRDVILSSIPDDFKKQFEEYLDVIAQEPDKLEGTIKQIKSDSESYFPFDIVLIDCFPINWNSSES